MLAGDRREGAAWSQVHCVPVLALHPVHVTRAPERVGEEESDLGRVGRHVGGPAKMDDGLRHASLVEEHGRQARFVRGLPRCEPHRVPGVAQGRLVLSEARVREAEIVVRARIARGRHHRAGQRAGRRQVLLIRDERGPRIDQPAGAPRADPERERRHHRAQRADRRDPTEPPSSAHEIRAHHPEGSPPR